MWCATGNRALFTLSEFATLPGTSDVLEKKNVPSAVTNMSDLTSMEKEKMSTTPADGPFATPAPNQRRVP